MEELVTLFEEEYHWLLVPILEGFYVYFSMKDNSSHL